MDERIITLERELAADPGDEGLQEAYFNAMRRAGRTRTLRYNEILLEQYVALKRIAQSYGDPVGCLIHHIGTQYGNVIYLNLQGKGITDKSLQHLPPHLKALDLRSTRVREKAIQELRKQRPTCIIYT